MAKRKRNRIKTRNIKTNQPKRARRRRTMNAGFTGILANPLVSAGLGAIGAGFIGYLISKPGANGEPMIKNPLLRVGIIAGAPFLIGKFMKAPGLALGGVGVGVYEMGKILLNKNSYKFGLNEGEIAYVDKNLLNEASTLSDGTTLADEDGNPVAIYENGEWSPYSADTY